MAPVFPSAERNDRLEDEEEAEEMEETGEEGEGGSASWPPFERTTKKVDSRGRNSPSSSGCIRILFATVA